MMARRRNFFQSLFAVAKSVEQKEMTQKEFVVDYQKKSKWLQEQGKASATRFNWQYDQYLSEYYDNVVARGKDEPLLGFDEFEVQRVEANRVACEELKQKKLHRIAHSRTKLTNFEKYLVGVSKLNEGSFFVNDEYQQGCLNKAPAELRQAIKRMRKRQDYAMLKGFEKKLNVISGSQQIYELFYGDDAKFGVGLIYKLGSDLGKFVMAENKIEGLSEEEIEKLAILEAI
jgi:hypothetical protein